MQTAKEAMPSTRTLWFVSYGPDASHLFDSRCFDRLHKARKFADELPLTPTGQKRPFVIERYEYLKQKNYGDVVQVSEVASLR